MESCGRKSGGRWKLSWNPAGKGQGGYHIGGYERYFEKNGKKYHHIIDPSTGYPAENGLTSVTIVSDDGTLADGLSTSLFIMGKEKAEKFWKKYNDKFDVILLTDDEQLYVSEGIADDFQSDYKVNVMKK